VIARVLARRRASPALAADATQAVYERLLVARSGAAPKIADYAGMGSLRAWVSTVAATTLLMIRRAEARRREEPPDLDGSFERATAAEPELRYLQERYKVELQDALRRALERLTDRERLLLRLHLGESMSIDALGAMYSVNRATAARWLASARAAILTGTREELTRALKLSPSEWASIVALVQSQLSVSVVRHLK
jgi:RNA polymerase sigma-70 factor (ECF subfamily)